MASVTAIFDDHYDCGDVVEQYGGGVFSYVGGDFRG